MQRHMLSCLVAALFHSLLVEAQSGDGGTADGFSNSNLGDAGSGADGSSNSSANLSRGAIIAIAVVVALVVFSGITLAVLFYLAKKRQWQVRQTIRRTTTRVVRAMTPRTPGFSFPRSPRPDQTPQTYTFMDKNKKMNTASTSDGKKQDRDVEKGFVSLDEQLLRTSEESSQSKSTRPAYGHSRTTSDVNKKLPKPKPTINVPSSHFEIDSPKSPMWQRLLGRK